MNEFTVYLQQHDDGSLTPWIRLHVCRVKEGDTFVFGGTPDSGEDEIDVSTLKADNTPVHDVNGSLRFHCLDKGMANWQGGLEVHPDGPIQIHYPGGASFLKPCYVWVNIEQGYSVTLAQDPMNQYMENHRHGSDDKGITTEPEPQATGEVTVIRRRAACGKTTQLIEWIDNRVKAMYDPDGRKLICGIVLDLEGDLVRRQEIQAIASQAGVSLYVAQNAEQLFRKVGTAFRNPDEVDFIAVDNLHVMDRESWREIRKRWPHTDKVYTVNVGPREGAY